MTRANFLRKMMLLGALGAVPSVVATLFALPDEWPPEWAQWPSYNHLILWPNGLGPDDPNPTFEGYVPAARQYVWTQDIEGFTPEQIHTVAHRMHQRCIDILRRQRAYAWRVPPEWKCDGKTLRLRTRVFEPSSSAWIRPVPYGGAGYIICGHREYDILGAA